MNVCIFIGRQVHFVRLRHVGWIDTARDAFPKADEVRFNLRLLHLATGTECCHKRYDLRHKRPRKLPLLSLAAVTDCRTLVDGVRYTLRLEQTRRLPLSLVAVEKCVSVFLYKS